MSTATNRTAVPQSVPRPSAVRSARRPMMIGALEIVLLTLSAIMVVVAIVSYFYFMRPAQSHLAQLRAQRDQLTRTLADSNNDLNIQNGTQKNTDEILGSLSDFENHTLTGRSTGRMVLYEDLNDLIHKNGLRNTSGPTFTSMEPLGTKTREQLAATASTAATANKWQSIYPGIAVNVTVEGQYQDIRRFVRDIENSKQFIIVNAVELERAQESGLAALTQADSTAPGKTLVSLRMDLTSYYQIEAPVAH